MQSEELASVALIIFDKMEFLGRSINVDEMYFFTKICLILNNFV